MLSTPGVSDTIYLGKPKCFFFFLSPFLCCKRHRRGEGLAHSENTCVADSIRFLNSTPG